MAVTGTLNVLIERVAYRPLRNAPKLAPPDHGGRVLVHLAERRPAVARRQPAVGPRPDRRAGRRCSPSAACTSCAATCSRFAVMIPLVIRADLVHRLDPGGQGDGAPPRRTRRRPRLMGINVNTTISLTFPARRRAVPARRAWCTRVYETNIWYFQGFQAGPASRSTAAVMGRHRQRPRRRARRADHRDHPVAFRLADRAGVDRGRWCSATSSRSWCCGPRALPRRGKRGRAG